jgi:hypothetical protein
VTALLPWNSHRLSKWEYSHLETPVEYQIYSTVAMKFPQVSKWEYSHLETPVEYQIDSTVAMKFPQSIKMRVFTPRDPCRVSNWQHCCHEIPTEYQNESIHTSRPLQSIKLTALLPWGTYSIPLFAVRFLSSLRVAAWLIWDCYRV